MAKKNPILPDLLAPGLRIVFCGTAAGTVSAARGHYYAHPQNKFWRALHAAALTPRLLRPDEFPELLTFGIGLTDIAKHVSGMDKELPPRSLGNAACADLRQRIAAHQPSLLAFTSLTAARNFLGRPVSFGPQPETLGGTEIWALPSPSPIAQWNWDEKWWRQVGEAAAHA
ncbi:MAG: mismatch-specific DNA-glycosylase [Alphaproteobacteria bacterium]|nr:mismatch-specific DNA-glycosylase [Alphaproteobacteria bacterium]